MTKAMTKWPKAVVSHLSAEATQLNTETLELCIPSNNMIR